VPSDRVEYLMVVQSPEEESAAARRLERRRRRAKPARPAREIRLVLGAAFVVAAAITLLAFEAYYSQRVLPGVYVWGVDLSGLTQATAKQRLETHFRYPRDRFPLVRHEGQSWPVDPADAGVELDVEATVDAALAVGKGPELVQALLDQARSILKGQAIVPRFNVDPAGMAAFLDRIAREVDVPPTDADLLVEPDLTITALPSAYGRQIDRDAAEQALSARIASLAGGDVLLPMRTVEPTLSSISAAQSQAVRILSAPLLLGVPDQPELGWWELSRPALAGMLTLSRTIDMTGQPTATASLDPGAVAHFVEGIAPQISRPPRDVQFRWDDAAGGLIVVSEEVPGQVLDVGRAVELLQAYALSTEREVPLPLQSIRPSLTREDLPAFGITERIGQGRTSFAGSPAGRVTNIAVASSRFDGVMVAPGESFSFNHYLGEVSAEEGYAEAYIIFGDRTTVGLGGGVCQVSTTAFRAAFWAGLPITERWAHGYRVGWYEPPVGMDATIYSPDVDLRFVNDTRHWILIQSHVDLQAGTLTFDFFGTSTGRSVVMEGPHTGEPIPHGEPIYRDDPTLATGTAKQIEWAKEGLDVSVVRVVYQDGVEVRRDTFVSHYEPWRAVFLVGTKE
jgi:vancomycin resistance protein YoaR